MGTLPMRFRMLEIMSDDKVYTVASMMEVLKKDYQGEGQLTAKNITTHFDSARAVGLIEVADADFDSNKELIMQYKITEFGHDRCANYLPKK